MNLELGNHIYPLFIGPPCNPSLSISPLLVCVLAVVQNPLQITSVRLMSGRERGLGREDLQSADVSEIAKPSQGEGREGGGVVSVI